MLILTATTILAVVLVTLLVFYQRYRSRNLPPGPWGLPLLGYLPFLGKNAGKTLTELSDKYGKVMSINLGGFNPVVVLSDWKSVKEALVTKGELFAGRNLDFYTEILVHNIDIVFTDGADWKKQKKLGQQMIRETNLESNILEEVDKLSQFLDSHDGHQVDVLDMFYIPTINVIWSVVAGKKFQQCDQEIRKLEKTIDNLVTIGKLMTFNILLLPNRKLLRQVFPSFCNAADCLHDYIGKEIEDHLRHFDENNLRDGIDVYLSKMKSEKGSPPFDCAHLTMTVLDFILAGQETVKSTMSWALLYMAHFPEIQQKVQQELDKVVDRDSFVPIQSKSLIPYTEATLMEIQRFASVLPLAVPHRATQDTNLSGYDIPKDTKVIVNLYGVHHDREYWGDPESFRPERFLDDDGQVLRHEALKPFSAGPRSCMGEGMAKQELHLMFTCLMRRFTFQFMPEEPKPNLDVTFAFLRKPQPFSLTVRRR